MNFLAHVHLSGGFPQLTVGNFIADFLRGGAHPHLPPGVRKGIELHRTIDAFTDAHPVVQVGIRRLRGRFRKYAPVVVDVFYDHFLAANWDAFHPTPLPEFAQQAYRLLDKHQAWLPPKVRQMLPYMATQDWLSNYAGFYGIGKALEGLSRRASFENVMHEGIADLQEHYDEFNREFLAFFPEMLQQVRPFWEEASQYESPAL
jgi:acyl carrier protein phosphodiesterase